MIEYVIKRDGRKEPFDAGKLNNWAQWSEKTINPKDFNWSGIVLRTVSLLDRECTAKELQDTLIKECLNQNTWESNRMAGRLYASALSKEFYETRKHPHIKELHNKLISLGVIVKPNYTDEEYEYINKLLNHKRDFTYSHYAINQLVQKYSLRDRIKKISYETPQFIYMRVVMDTLNFYTKSDRLEKLKDLYEELSLQRVVVPTPYFANSLTSNPNKISCSVITCTDEAESIGVLNTLAYTLTTSGAGVGAHMKTRSINDPVRGGLVKHAGKVPYYRAFASIMKSSTQGSRSGAATMYFPIFDPEIEVLVGLKNPLSVLANRVRDSDYGVSLNKPFLKRALTGKPFWLFSYKDNPELYEKFYHWDSETFDKELEQFAKDNPNKVTQVDAKQLLSTALTHRIETGRLYPHFADISNFHTPYKETIYSSNLCVSPETLILHREGYTPISELEDQEIEIWNGEQWSKTTVHKTGSNQKLIKIITDSGYELECTPYHKFYIQTSYNKSNIKCVEAKDLKNGDKLIKFDLPIIQGKLELENAYVNGFYSGDGCLTQQGQRIYLYHEKRQLKYLFDQDLKWTIQEKYNREYVHYNNLKDKFFVPTSDYTIQSRLNWLEGISDSDGCIYKNGSNNQLVLSSIEKEFLKEIQLMLQTLGITSKIKTLFEESFRKLPCNDGTGELKDFWCQHSYRLLIPSAGLYKLIQLGFNPKRLVLDKNRPQRDATQFIKIERVEDIGRYDDTFCFTEPLRNMGMFNGILAGNCLEISNVTKPYKTHLELYSDNPEGVVGFCNLAGINLGVVKDDEEYEKACYYALFMIEQAIETASLPFPALNKNLKDYRSAGVGICSLAYLMAKNNKSYTTQEGRDFIFEQAERHQYFLTKAAIKLTEELGPCEAMTRNKYSEGWLPFDNAPKAVFDLITTDFKYDWESLRERMKELGGLRFTTLSCLMPAESSSIAVSGTNSIYPLRDLTLVKTSGDTTNIWVAPEASKFAKKYEIVWDLPSEHLINLYALWQIFIDQSISADTFVDRTKNVSLPMSAVFKDLAQAAKLGVKTFYYMNTLTDKKDTFEFLNGLEDNESFEQISEEAGCSSGGCTL